MVGFNAQHGRVALDFDAQLARLVDIALRVFGAGELFLEAVQAKAVMDALAQDAAGVVLAFEHEEAVHAVFPGRDGGRQTRGARTDHQHVDRFVKGACFHGHYSSASFIAS